MKPQKKKSNSQREIGSESFKALIENAHEGIVLYDNSGNITYASNTVKKISGFNAKEVIKKNGLSFVHPDDADASRKAFYGIQKKHGKSVTLIQRLRHKKGHYYWAESVLTNFLHVPSIRGIVSNFRDITEKMRHEESDAQTQGILETVNQNLSEGVYMGIVGGPFIYVNDALVKTLGYRSSGDLMKVRPAELYANEEQHKFIISELAKTGKLREVEAEFYKKNGSTFWGVVNVSLLPSNPNELRFVGTLKDITKEKETALALVDSRNFLDNIINTVATPLFVKDSKLRWVTLNDAFCAVLGKSRRELLGKSDSDFLSPTEAAQFRKIDRLVLKTGKTKVTEEVITTNGERRTLYTVKSLSVNDKGEKFVIGFITDITAFKNAEREINHLNASLQGVLESTSESIFAIDREYKYISFNNNHKRVMKLLYKAEIDVGTDKLKCIQGSIDEKWLTADLRYAMKGHHFITEKRLDYPQYRDRTIQLTYNPIRGEKRIEGVAVYVSDITDRKQYEAKLKSLNDELTQQNWNLAAQDEELKATLDELSERNFELDQLMYKTSHDLRSPLSSIMGLVNLGTLDVENVPTYLKKIEDRIKKLDEFIKSMLNYARANRLELGKDQINLKAIAESAIHELAYLENFQAIKTTVEVENDKIPYHNDAMRVSIIFSNIISNAYKYYNVETNSFLKVRIVVNPMYANVEFIDNGIGIRREHLDKIFNMFYRATETSQGSGLGMYIVKQALDKIGGEVFISSEYGIGTTIKITIPNL